MDASTLNHRDQAIGQDVRNELHFLVADAPVSPFDLRPLCPTCSRATRLAVDGTGTWLIGKHPSPVDHEYNCSGSSDPVSYAAYEDAIAAHAATSVHAGESTYSRDITFKSAQLDKTYSDDERDFRHSGWSAIRAKVRNALERADVRESRRVAFQSCGSNAWLMKSTIDKDSYRIASSHCHDRFCTPCALDRSHVIRCNLRFILRERRRLPGKVGAISHRFLTLTVKTRPGEPLAGTLDNLSTWFKALRATRLWRSCVFGGVAMLELKWNGTPGRWHPHLHIIIEGNFLPHGALKRVWHGITKSSYICHIKPLRDDDATINYVTKYTSKPLDGSYAHDPELLVEAVEALAGRKLLAAFGCWHRFAILRREPGRGWEIAMTFNTLIARSNAGDRESQRILALVTANKPDLGTLTNTHEPEEPP